MDNVSSKEMKGLLMAQDRVRITGGDEGPTQRGP